MSSRIVLRNCLFGINLSEGPLYFASPAIKDNCMINETVLFDENIPVSELLNSIFYNIGSLLVSPQDDIIKCRVNDRRLESSLRAKWNGSGCIWSSFVLAKNSETKSSYHSSFVVKFSNEDKENTRQHTRDIIDFAKSFGIPSISKLVPTDSNSGYTVDVISCESQTNERIDQFDVLPVKYSGYHPLFDFRSSIYKSFDETQSMLDLAYRYFPLPEIEALKRLANTTSNKALASKDAYPNPFIVVEGLDGVGKTTLVTNLAKRLGAELFHTPPDVISEYRELMVKQCEPVCRAYYSLGNYIMAENVKDSLVTNPVVLDRYWHSSAAYAIAKEAKCGDETNIPPKGNSIYHWPGDLLKPSAVVFLELSENDRLLRMRDRGETETNEELLLKRSQLLRQRVVRAFKNMENPGCIIIDASKGREEVCENVIMELRNRKILTV